MTELTSDDRFGRCINDGYCSLADKRTPIPLKPGDPLICPECGKPIIVIPPAGKPLVDLRKGPKAPPKRLLFLGLFIVALIGIGVAYNLFRPLPEEVTTEEEEEIAEAAGYVPPPQQEGDGEMNFEGRKVVNLFTLGATPDTRTTLAPELVAAFMRSRGCVGVSQQLTKLGQLRLSCDVEDKKLVATIAGVDAASAFENRPGGAVNLLLTTTPEDKGRTTTVIGHEAVAVIVNPANSLRRLSLPQLAAIFSGKTGDFAAVGGNGGAIHPIAGRDNASEVQAFSGLVLGGQPLPAATRRLADAAGVMATVGSDRAAIGLVTPDRIGTNKALGIGTPGGIALGPAEDAITSGRYPLARQVVIQIPTTGRVRNAAPFASFASGREGQQVLKRAGLVTLPEAAAPGAGETAPASYPPLLEGADRLPFTFRFQPGTSALDAASEAAIAAAAADIVRRKLPQQRLIVAGFADGSPDAQSLSLRLAERVGQALTAKGVTPGAVRGLGDAMPLAENSSPEGRAKNRRVELWFKP